MGACGADGGGNGNCRRDRAADSLCACAGYDCAVRRDALGIWGDRFGVVSETGHPEHSDSAADCGMIEVISHKFWVISRNRKQVLAGEIRIGRSYLRFA